jgi:hypothetical protein
MILVLTWSGAGYGQLSESEIQSLIGDFFTLLRTDPIKYGPDMVRLMQLRSEYAKTLSSPSLIYQGMNTDVIADRDKLLSSSPCLAEMTINFYLNLIEAHDRNVTNNTFTSNPADFVGGEPSLAAQAKTGDGFGSSGWVWSEAMHVAGDDPDLAMNIISVWTHDDRHLYMRLNSTKGLSKDVLERLQLAKKKFREHIVGMGMPSKQADDYADQILNMSDSKIEINAIPLPKEILFPGALDAQADLSSDLKTKIAQIQAPNKGPQALPAKYYHVYGGASAACMLREHGISPEVATLAQKKIAEIYREKRLCADVDTMSKINSQFQKRFETSQKSNPSAMAYDDFLDAEAARLLSKPNECPDSAVDSSDDCKLIKGYFGTLSPLYKENSPLSDVERKQKIQVMMDRMNASTILIHLASTRGDDGSYCGNSSQIYKDLQTVGLSIDGKIKRDKETLPLCDHLNQADCQRAIHTIKTWEVDFDWTIAQQEAGAKFGADKCTPLGRETLNNRCERVKSGGGTGTPAQVAPAVQ